MPAALTLFGPLIDPSFKTAMADRRTVLNPINPRVAQRFLALYTGNDDIDDPRLSLLHAPAGGLPPIQMHYGTLEVMRAEAELFAARVTGAGGSCVQRVWPNLLHGYWLSPSSGPKPGRASAVPAGSCTTLSAPTIGKLRQSRESSALGAAPLLCQDRASYCVRSVLGSLRVVNV